MTEETNAEKAKVDVAEPILLNLGKQKRKRIKKLMKGKGKLWGEVQDVIDEVSYLLDDELEGKTIVPLILVYRRKPKNKRPRGFFGF
jgi:hypothetical protein